MTSPLAVNVHLPSRAWRLDLETLHQAFHTPGSTAYRWVDGAVWVLIAISIGLFAVDVGLDLDQARAGQIAATVSVNTLIPAVTGVGSLPGTGMLDSVVQAQVQRSLLPTGLTAWLIRNGEVLAWVDAIILWLFGIELALRVLTFRPEGTGFYEQPLGAALWAQIWGRVRFLTRPMNLVDLIVVIAVYPALRGLRALRLLRLARAVRFFRYANPITDVLDAFRANRLLYQAAFSFLIAITGVGGLSFYLVERRANPGIETIGDGLWWSIVTLTTVGFGDISPITPLGRVVGATLMVGGMFTLALFAGVVGNTLLNSILSFRQEQFRMSNSVGHIIVLGYDHGSQALLTALTDEFARGEKIVLLGDGAAPPSLPESVEWVPGDPTREAELDKVRVQHATGVIVVGKRSLAPEQADAITLLTLFTLRSYMRSRPDVHRRRPLYVIAEVLDAENVEHARTAGADEVIESTKLGFSLLAHAMAEPGTAAVMSRVAAAGAHNLYVGVLPDTLPSPISFGEALRHFRAGGQAMLIGVRDPKTGRETLNPPDDLVLDGALHLVYIAKAVVLPSPHA